MSNVKEREFTGRHMLMIMVGAFGTIIAVNLTMAYNAVSTFPGLEVKNSYVASQKFDENRDAQLALGWDVSAKVEEGMLHLIILDEAGQPVEAELVSATLGRATHVRDDFSPALFWTGMDFAAPVDLDGGNWNLRLQAKAPDGTVFQQRMILHVRD
ncbi:FixH family protein [Tropicimonas sp. S265A]|uniref:FixH family protein n=1 Tax=Tropicimonas sp. S265A TaxID=3415134 RepID=UPI003C7E4509